MWGTYTKEFSRGVWVGMGAMTVLLTLALYGTTTVLEVGEARLSLPESFIVVIGALTGQGKHHTQVRVSHSVFKFAPKLW